jgi:hypothetical protein
MRWSLVVAACLTLSLAACGRPSHEECVRLCWRYNELQYWDRFERDAAALDPEARAALKTERQRSWDEQRKQDADKGRDNCVTGCRQGGKRSQVACVDKAKTAAEAVACLADD